MIKQLIIGLLLVTSLTGCVVVEKPKHKHSSVIHTHSHHSDHYWREGYKHGTSKVVVKDYRQPVRVVYPTKHKPKKTVVIKKKPKGKKDKVVIKKKPNYKKDKVVIKSKPKSKNKTVVVKKKPNSKKEKVIVKKKSKKNKVVVKKKANNKNSKDKNRRDKDKKERSKKKKHDKTKIVRVSYEDDRRQTRRHRHQH